MRQLTFTGFLKQYLSNLSATHTTSIARLARESVESNARLREPLLLYAMLSGRVQALLTVTDDTPCAPFFRETTGQTDGPALMQRLEAKDPSLPYEFHKVWASYQVEKMKPAHDASMKALIRNHVLTLKEKRPVSTYRLCKDLRLNNANVCTWLRTGDPRMVTVDSARKIWFYLENSNHQPL